MASNSKTVNEQRKEDQKPRACDYTSYHCGVCLYDMTSLGEIARMKSIKQDK